MAVGIYLLKVNNRNTRTRCETPFIVNLEHISHLVLMFIVNIDHVNTDLVGTYIKFKCGKAKNNFTAMTLQVK